jgi:hypothetical protein
MKVSELKKLVEEIASIEVKNNILSENKEVFHIKCDGEPIASFKTKEEAEEALPDYKAKNKGELIIEKGVYESYSDMIDKFDEMSEELEETDNMKNTQPMEGNKFSGALKAAKDAGEKSFTIDGKKYDVEECWSKQMEEEKEECDECGEMNESQMCSECGGELNEEGLCNECGGMVNETKKKKVLRLTESQMLQMIKQIVSESVPGIEVTKKAQSQSKKDNENNAKEVGNKIKKATKMEGGTNPEFPNQNGGEKEAIHNTEEENEFVQDNRGGTALNLDYDSEPSEKFKDRLKKSIEGDSTMGNSQDAANVVKSDLGKNIMKQAERKAKKEKSAPMYNKDVQPVKEVNESEMKFTSLLNEELDKMKKIATYNKKTQ